ncbi:DUF6879 family protein [Streptomyces sp. NPDC003006]
MLLDGDEWRRRFAEIKQEAWRLETLPQYLVPHEAEEFAAFREGRTLTPYTVSPYTVSPYTERISRQRAEGKRNGRVQIRILDVTKRANPLEGVHDFWMFDRAEVVLMNYEADGRQINREVFEGDVSPFIEYQRIAVRESVPFEEYVNGGHRA